MGIGTAVPDKKYSQKILLDTLVLGSKELRESSIVLKTKKVFESCSVETRHLVVTPQDLLLLAGTGSRNVVYEKCAPELARKAAVEAIKDWGGDVKDITHIISVSCTGTVVPGMEFMLVNSLGLNRSVGRLSINFMGCFGALAALRNAHDISAANPTHRILIVCTELCSLHIQKDEIRFDNLIGTSIFGDGAAAVIVGGACPNPNEKRIFEILRSTCFAIPDSEDKIRWNLSDSGWKVGLAPDIPLVFKRELPNFCKAIMEGQSSCDICQWAIHPGGKSVVETIEKVFNLKKEQTESSDTRYIRLFELIMTRSYFCRIIAERL